jgi:hypothetical protein
MVIYYLAVSKLLKCILRRVYKIKWRMKPSAAPGARPHSLVNWTFVCRPKELSGLGIFDIEKFGRARRLRWLWYACTDPSRPWFGSDFPCDVAGMMFFRASTNISIGDGDTSLFWHGH